MRQLYHKIKILLWLLKEPRSSIDFLGQACISSAGRWNGELNPMYTYMKFVSTLIENSFEGLLLEFGGGYSTVLFNHYLNQSNIQLVTVEAYPLKYNRILNSRRNTELFKSSITLFEQLTVNYEQATRGAYLLIHELSQYCDDELKHALEKYIRDTDLVLSVVKQIKSGTIVSALQNHKHTADELSVYSLHSGDSFLNECTSKESPPSFDAIFFDCGEFSSMAEWMFFKDMISIGGYALLHDIFYPKSIKNFLVATYISLSSSWEVIAIDKYTSQGGLVAQRCS